MIVDTHESCGGMLWTFCPLAQKILCNMYNVRRRGSLNIILGRKLLLHSCILTRVAAYESVSNANDDNNKNNRNNLPFLFARTKDKRENDSAILLLVLYRRDNDIRLKQDKTSSTPKWRLFIFESLPLHVIFELIKIWTKSLFPFIIVLYIEVDLSSMVSLNWKRDNGFH